jgi:hypothetical protein
MTRIISIKIQCNKLLNYLCEIQYSEALLGLKSNASLSLNERM